MNEIIGKKVADLLKRKELGQAWLAEQVGVSVNAVSKWTKTGEISRKNLPKVAEALGVSIDELVSATPPTKKEKHIGTKLERLDPEESALLEVYREFGPDEREILLSHAKLLLGPKAKNYQLFRGRDKL